nr:ORF1 [Anelloviridae sp.]
MPYWWRRRYPRWRRRQYRRRRPFRPFRRTFYRRRYRVRRYSRKRKLNKLTVKQWQPKTIRRSNIKGLYCLFMATSQRLSNNFIQWMESTAPPHWPGGGGFSILQFSLQALYEQFLKVTNWWTKSNCNLPIVRYLKLILKFYRAEKYDYLVSVERCLPFEASDLMYISTHPAVMMLTKNVIFVPCRQNSSHKKPYKKVRVNPPSQMTTKWHFQQDIATFPLVVIRACAASFDRMYTASNAINSTIGFNSLNLSSFQLHNWNQPPTTGYKPQENQWLYGLPNMTTEQAKNCTIKELVYLGGTGPFYQGQPINEDTNYFSTPAKWGNIFHPKYLTGLWPVYVTNQPTNIVLQKKESKISDSTIFTLKSTPNIIPCRYNPFSDKGVGNSIFLVNNHTSRAEWTEPDDPLLERKDLPLWLLPFGFLDWHKKFKRVQSIDTNYMTIITSKYIEPQQKFYLVLDDTFLQGFSPYSKELFDNDSKYWYPKNRFQVDTLNTIATCGPGIIKLPKQISCEAHFLYNFQFKFGGCPPPMEKVCSPAAETKYPVPDTKHETTSLQSPETPIQTYLYSFDERKGLLTAPAAKRIKKDYSTETTSLPIAGPSTDLQPPHQTIQEESEETTEEEEKEDILLQLRLLRKKQRHLRERILQLLDTSNIE